MGIPEKFLELLLQERNVDLIYQTITEKDVEELCLTAIDVMMQEGNLQMVSTPVVV